LVLEAQGNFMPIEVALRLVQTLYLVALQQLVAVKGALNLTVGGAVMVLVEMVALAVAVVSLVALLLVALVYQVKVLLVEQMLAQT
jgi:hypothetical protein